MAAHVQLRSATTRSGVSLSGAASASAACDLRVRSGLYGADPGNILWLDQVEALTGHTFLLRGGAGSAVREYVYDADRDELRPERTADDLM